ncbi:MAG TPA: energy transducer TonB [Pseudomonas sp.]|uniref:energy transducer TonB n=1 Tax=Pseudomonas sp. TaxID=306 RepID=UPI002ED98D22
MRFCAFSVFLLCSFKALAADVLLIPVFTPKPEYPKQLIDTRYTGKVRVNLTVAAHGGIQATKIIESSHPQLTEATQRVVVQWRFKPWDASHGQPSKIEVTVPILFGARGIEPFSREITVGLRNTLCAYLNYEVKTSLLNFADEPLKNVDVFWYTHDFLAGSYVQLRVSDQSEREALIAQLEKAIPRLVRKCRRNPDHPYAYYLPREIRDVLVGL